MDDTNARLNLLLSLGRYRDVEKAAREAVAAAPEWARGHVFLALALGRQGYLQDARQSALTAVGKAPDDPWTHAVLASTQLALGQHQLALDAARVAIRSDPRYPGGYNYAAAALYRLKRYTACRNMARNGLRTAPGDHDLMAWLGWAEWHCGTPDQVISIAENALRVFPDSAPLRHLYAAGLRRRNHPGDATRADELLEEAIRIDPTEEIYRRTLAESRSNRSP